MLNDWTRKVREWDANGKTSTLVGCIYHDERAELMKAHIIKIGYEAEIGNTGYQGYTTMTVRRLSPEKCRQKLIKISKEVFTEDTEFREYIFKDAKAQMKKEGYEPVFHYLTFHSGSVHNGLIDLVVTNYVPRKILLTAPESDIEEAIQWVKDNNPHLDLLKGSGKRGYNNDDFVTLQISVELYFTIKEPA